MELINLTTKELLDLILEKNVQKENCCIASKSSFLSILALLEDEMQKRSTHVRLHKP